jgi:TolB-like protein/DNA-binding winged helix-turn-helix (wHTH) protein
MQPPTDGAPSGISMAYAVGDLVVDVARVQVTRNGVEVPLPKLSFDLLVALIESAPAVVSLDALMKRVWAGVIVSPETVSQRAKLLRDALDDDTRTPRYFTSVRGRGYRLVATVQPLPPPAVSAAAVKGAAITSPVAASPVAGNDSPPTRPSTPVPGRGLRVLLALALTAALALGAWFVATRDDPSAAREVAAPIDVPERSIAVLPFKSTSTTSVSDVLSFGIAEAVLHQLANQQGVVVIARASSFALGPEPGDARQVGRQLNVRYMLEGSVQQAGDQMRVTARLIDTRTGTHVWSIRFDKPVTDVFAVQDEIAAQVADALQLSVRPDAVAHIAGQGTAKFDAYLAYMQGRALLATGRIGDGSRAITRFVESLRLDPAFAAAEVSLAEAELFVAEFGNAEGRAERFERAARRASSAIERALALDPRFGPAYLLRGYLEAFTDLDQAEASYRRGLSLRPNDARGFAGLAMVLFERPAQRAEALQMLDRARRLDPLESAHDVTKSVYLLYDRGDVRGADELLQAVLNRDPKFVPALVRRGELAWCCDADASTAVELLEQALAIDPTAQWPRRILVRAYLDADDPRAAAAVIEESVGAQAVLRVPLLAYEGDWRRAGEAAYAALDAGMVAAVDELAVVVAIRRHARLTGDYPRAIVALERRASVTWRDDLTPTVPRRPGLRVPGIGLADMLLASGQTDRAHAVLDKIVAQMESELREAGRSDTWYCHGMSVAAALRGEPQKALGWLRRGVEIGSMMHDGFLVIGGDPAFGSLRPDPAFAKIERAVRERARREAGELAQLRSAQRVPTRP